jgi:DUF971 family protein
MPLDLPDTESPDAVELDRAERLTLRWHDGEVTHFALGDLRRNCPCAECRGLREQGREVGVAAEPITAVDAQLVGAWGLSIHWSDGHQTGIYAWSLLRAWAGLDERT